MKLLSIAIISLTLFVSCAHKGADGGSGCGCHDKKAACADCALADKKGKPGGCKDCDAAAAASDKH